MKFVELHCHSYESPDSLISSKKIAKWLSISKIDVVAITDHNTTKGAIALANDYPDRIIVGEEIEVSYQGKIVGEILAYFVQDEIPGGEEVIEVLGVLKNQGAYVSLPHPLDKFRTHWTLELLEKIMPMIEGIEVFNSRCVRPTFNSEALDLAQRYSKHELVGSDAHSIYEIGRSYHIVEDFDDVVSFRNALSKSEIVSRISPYWVHGLSRLAVLRNRAAAKP